MARKTSENDQRFALWPDWVVGDMPSLAQYVSVPALDDIGLPAPDRFTRADPASGREIARSIYEGILSRRLRYMHEPWREEGFGYQEFAYKQRVRYPAWLMRDGGGTCLDLAILYAAALMRAQIRPYIAILYPAELADSVRGVSRGHALVIADLGEPLTDQHWERDAPSPMEKAASEQGAKGALVIRGGRELPSRFLALDPTRATTNFPLGRGRNCPQAEGFAQAEAAAAACLAGMTTKLCDVATARIRGYPELPRPADGATPAIWSRLPESPEVSDYPSRRGLRKKLAQACGRIVIYGTSGLGKSTLAGVRARAADGGYGWFLNATDRSTLQSQLAQAENDQRARNFAQPLEELDQASFSELAIRRLEVSEAPWVLVLDNADGKPGDITPMLPRGIGPDQAVIVTTTNPDWLTEWPESDPGLPTTHIVLEPLEDGDMTGVDARLHSLTVGCPLFYEAARTAISSGAQIPREPENAAGLAWQLAQDYLSSDPDAVDLAHLIAWAPPVALPVTKLGELTPVDAPQDDSAVVARSLAQAGLVQFFTQPVPSVLMHRLIATRIRADERLVQMADQDPVPAPVALMASRAGQDLMARLGDVASFKCVEEELARARDLRVSPRAWGLAVFGIARAGEIRGRSRQSSALFDKAIGFLDPQPDRSLLSECWNGRARYLKDYPPADPREHARALGTALSWATTARELATEAAASAITENERLWELVRTERAHAMQGLIMRKSARDITDPATKKQQLADAMDVLVASEGARTGYLHALGIEDSPDIDRARFNLGGSGIGLAKLSRDAEAERYLRAALEAYDMAKQLRVRRFGEGMALPAVASCDNGIALAYYYSALLEVDPRRAPGEAYRPSSPQTRMSLLRQASAACGDALRDRTLLAPSDRDDSDATKSGDLFVKLCQMRKLITAFQAKGQPLTLAEAGKELGFPQTWELHGRELPEVLAEARDLAGILNDAADERAMTCHE